MSDFSQQSLPRRSFLRGHFLNALQTEQVKQQGHNAIRPPWTNLADFYQKCTACNNCISACETQIIIKGASGYPEIDFNRGECTFCQACVKSCEADVFLAITEQPWTHKVEVQDSCLLKQRVECRSCGDSCESRAIRFRPALGGIANLVLDLTACNGCGACLSVCPTKAIRINKENNE
ncbi:ferredoxin-type protein NapF [Actinobacillus ureae]|uniref:Ferredoxin-type protein NapF n=1 Tax=Actinobacillus ureae ATCC 25976 TaxID=887324 RepID=E8KKP4_9PAST|nr:ferredoxin-type protein NapF [Actinobacillus ureae]EFX90547.1 ferredoxin-type protein NapF [Actinobacillus ureae ATCC 25976]SUT87725.1 ferredoxin-type protein NapF [Actinobacillus ureae]SUU49381.1 ferredoxin-type protein NapF [Actinobacillus ureae]